MEKVKQYIPNGLVNIIAYRVPSEYETGYETWEKAHDALLDELFREVQLAERYLRALEDDYHKAKAMTEKGAKL